MTTVQTPVREDVIAHLRRLEQAACAGDVVKEVQHLAACFGACPALFSLSLRSLTALAEGHLRERQAASRDALTGLLDARTFGELLCAHRSTPPGVARIHALSVVLTVLDVGHGPPDLHSLELIKIIARMCARNVATDDHLGRVGPASIAVFPRHGDLRAARAIRHRLVGACQAEFADAQMPLRLMVSLRDPSKRERGSIELLLGKQLQVA